MAPAPRIFVSYARSDGKAFATDLSRRLREHGFSLWRDLSDMEGGRGWWAQIEEAIRAVEYLVLVMTAGDLRKESVVRREWRLARQEGKRVLPVIGQPDLTESAAFKALLGWMRRAHWVDPDEPEQWTHFVRTLEGPCEERRVPFMADDLPEGFVQRPQQLEELVAGLLQGGSDDPVAITGVLQGAGGFGKTALACALCHDERIQEAFDEGMLWVTLGEEPGDLRGRIGDLLRVLTGQRPAFDQLQTATARLAETIGERRMLLVIDDVWDPGRLRPFLQGGPHCARLITTRDRSTVPATSYKVRVDAMEQDQAAQLLGFGLPLGDSEKTRAVAARLGEWPLLLKLANGWLRQRVNEAGKAVDQALDDVLRALEKRGLTAFDARDPKDRDEAVAKTLGLSLELLDEGERQRFAELAVFPEDLDVPLAAVETLWSFTGSLDDFDTEELCQNLFRYSLLLDLDSAQRQLRLHDVVRAYLLPQDKAARQALQLTLVDAYRARCPHGWARGADDGYFFQQLPYHLAEAGLAGELRGLLLDYDWIAAKLEATDVAAVIADYNWLSGEEDGRLVQQALMLSAHVLARDKHQLPGQLVGRLRGLERSEIGAVVTQAQADRRRPWLCPQTPSLTPPGGPLLQKLAGHESAVKAVAMTPDGRRAVSGSTDRTVRLWDLETGMEIRRLEGHEKIVTAVAVTADGRRVLSGSLDGTVRLWDVESGMEIRRLGNREKLVAAVAVTVDGCLALSGDVDGRVRLWDLKTGEEIRRLDGEHPVRAVALTADGRRAVSGGDGGMQLWDLSAGTGVCRLPGHEGKIRAVAVTADGRYAVSGSDDRTVRLWDLEARTQIRRLDGHEDVVTAVAVTTDGRRAISGSGDTTVRLWDMKTGEEIRRLEGHKSRILTVALAAYGQRAISASDPRPDDATIRLWNLAAYPGARRQELKANARQRRHQGSVKAIAVTADGRYAVSGSDDRTVRLWDLETGAEIRRLEGHEGHVTAVAVTADGRCALSGSSDRTVRLWDLETGTEIRHLGHENPVTAVGVTADGRRAISGSGRTVRLWDLETGAEIRRLERHHSQIYAFAVTADGRRAVSGTSDSAVRLWDLVSGSEIRRLKGHRDLVNAVAVTTDGRRVVSGSWDNTVRLWNLETGAEIRRLEGHESAVTAVAVSADGRRAVSGSWDHTVRLWNLESGATIAQFTCDDLIWCAALARKDLFVAGCIDGAVHILRLME